MPAPTYPTVLPAPIASNAASVNITNPIPESPTGSNAASVLGGFPPVTMESELAGGLPPLGPDFNGYLFLLSGHTVFLQAGGLYLYDADVSAAIGGYAAGAVLGMADGSGAWVSIQNNNTGDPDANTTGNGWVPAYSIGAGVVNVPAAGSYQLTSAAFRKSIIILQGALTGNLSVIFPDIAQEWVVVNNTTGSGTVTAVGLAGGGGGTVTIPRGGAASPTQVYSLGDASVYPTVAPLSIPIDQAATPLTIAERTNLGDLLARMFNVSIADSNNAIVNMFYDVGDGSTNRMTFANFIAQLVATGAFEDALSPNSSFGATWHRANPDGSIECGGVMSFAGGGGTQTVAFPVTYATLLGLSEGVVSAGGTGGAGTYVHNFSVANASGFTYHTNTATATSVYWRAIGV